MIQCQLKLRLTKEQEDLVLGWLWNLTGVWNFAVRKIEQDAKDGIYHSGFDFQNLLANHSERIGIPGHVLQGTLKQAKTAWDRCFKKLGNKPKLKGNRRPLNSIPFPDPIKEPAVNRISLPILGKVKFHKQEISKGKIKGARMVKRASGWYLCLFIDAPRKPIKRKAEGKVGIDPGFKELLVLSTGEKVTHPREFEASEERLGQAQRGHHKHLASRIHERIANQKKDRNHKLSLRLVENFTEIYFSKDNTGGIAHRFGKSVSSSNHYQLRQMLKYKSLTGGTKYVEVESRNSTRTCSKCGFLTGPTGLAGLSVRHWGCKACGASHDRDINASINTLNVGAGLALENTVMVCPEFLKDQKGPYC
jgi:transposase